MKIQLFITVIDNDGKTKGFRCMSNDLATHEYDFDPIIKDMKDLKEYWIDGMNNTMMLHKKAIKNDSL